MNENTVKVLAEAIAFSKVGNDTIEHNKTVFSGHMSEEDMNFSSERSGGHAEAIEAYTKEKGVDAQVNELSKSIQSKLSSMRDSFIREGDDTSVLQWWGFFGGASLTQWNMVKGVFETLEDDAMVAVAYDAIGYHEDLYDTVSEALTEIARKNSKQ